MTDPARNVVEVAQGELQSRIRAKIRAGHCLEDSEDGDVNFCGQCDWCLHILADRALASLAISPEGAREGVLLEILARIVEYDDDAKAAKGKGGSLNGYGLVDMFDSVGHPFGEGPHKQQSYRSINLDVALLDARAVLAAALARTEGGR